MFSTPKPGYGALLAALTLLSLAVAAPAQGQTPLTQQDAELFAKFDNDGNGQLSIAEIGAWPWGRYDQNRDGQVTTAEFLAGRRNDRQTAQTTLDAEQAWELLDWNGDGKWLSGTELDNGLWSRFDANNDGQISKTEFLAQWVAHSQEEKQTAPGPVPEPAAIPELKLTTALGKPTAFVAVSEFKQAKYNDLVVDPAATLHAVWQDRDPQTYHSYLFHRASRDGGATWGPLTNLSTGQPDGYTGIPRLMADAAGRVYAIWKVLDRGTSMFDEERLYYPVYGTLVYRVLEHGRWSPAIAVGSARTVLSWYPSVDPQGRVHLVWSESPQPAVIGTGPANASIVQHAQLDGPMLRGISQVLNASAAGGANKGYWGLSGYVNAQGSPRWIAVRETAAADAPVLVYWNGSQESVLLNYRELKAGYAEQSPPRLVRDRRGQEHLIWYNGDATQPAVLDYLIGQNAAPSVIYQLRGTGKLNDFQISQGAAGQLIATAQIAGGDTAGLADLYVSIFENGTWSAPVNVTNNAARTRQAGVTDVTGRSLGIVKVANAAHAAAVYDSAGRLNLLMSNREISTYVHTGQWGTAMGESKVFFTKF